VIQLIPTTAADVEQQAKQQADEKYWKKFLYFFELRIASPAFDGDGVGPQFAMMPLILAPQRMTMGEPFAVKVAPTLGGGLYVEESGILARPMQIAGTTGFAPRLLDRVPVSSKRVRDELRSYVDRTVEVDDFVRRLSGQKQLQMLQDRIFRLYADLKRNPETSAGTELIWHNIKDDEHWRVIPQSFELRRASRRSTMYFYNIQMLAVEPAAQRSRIVSEDHDLFDEIGDPARSIREGIDLVSGTLDNVGGLGRDTDDSIRSYVSSVRSVTQIAASANNVAAASADFVNGRTTEIRGVTSDGLLQLLADTENLLDAMDSSLVAVGTLPASVRADWTDLERGLQRIAAWPDRLQTALQARVTALDDGSETTEAESAAVTAQVTFRGVRAAGTRPRLGDARKRRAARLETRRRALEVAGLTERTVGQGQTIHDIAAEYLDDASRYREIAAINDLRAPYIHPAGLPGTLRPGDQILIPSRASRQTARTLPVVRGTDLLAPETHRLFGVDWRLEPSSDGSGLYDMVLDEANNAGKDVKRVAGIPNLEQAVGTRLRTNKGDSAMYRELGTNVVVGMGNTVVDTETARLHMTSAVQDDPRIVTVSGVQLAPRGPDSIDVEFNASVYGLSDRVNITSRT